MNNKSKLLVPVIVLIAIIIAYPFVVGQAGYYLSVAMKVLIMVIFAESYNLLLGYTGIVSLGHALFFGLGSYISAILMLRYHWNFWLTLIPTVVVCVLAAVAVGLLSLRVKAIYFTMLTLALGQLLFVAANKAYNFTGGEDGLPGVPGLFQSKTASYYAIAAITIAVIVLLRKFVSSPTGMVLQAIRENEMRTKIIGYNVLNYKLIVLVLSGALAGIAGSLYVTYSGIVYPALASSERTMEAIFMCVIGGTGNLAGPAVGAFIVVVASTILNNFTNRWLLFFGIVFVVVIMFMPTGITGILSGRKKKEKDIETELVN
ncbi:MAG: branched-chain amino acid ABC transporter permease [Lachnospiraceae bacterium]|nr:branched-chain amino acid ABC transporter permease [Lachnospiraceae bacterium]